jgi:hypothetical protein
VDAVVEVTSAGDQAALVGSDHADGPITSALASNWWGIGLVPWLWGTRLKILFVTDGRITESEGTEEFGLGLVLKTLRDPSFAWWVRFEVEVVSRNSPESFRFTQQGFDIDDYDQVWLFGDEPGPVVNDSSVGDEVIELDANSPLRDAELRVVAEWMERGGGVFATGDHSLLGASMCYRIPRVRSMRKWTRAQGVPSFGDPDRHQTVQQDPSTGILAWEGDRYPQRIFPVYRRLTGRPVAVVGEFPHPLLCGKDGVIDHFPDHMHEGGVIEDDDIELNKPLGIPGIDGVEYPVDRDVFQPTAAVGGPEVFGFRPRPQVIAHGWTTNEEAEPVRFGVVGAYDGDRVKIGRVVVDSTWHHWLSMNLVGFRDQARGFYRGMQDYYRNVGLWLSTPEQRASMLLAATWGVLVGKQPGALGKVMGVWEIGERVLDVIGRTAPQCIVSELVSTFMASGGQTADEGAPQRLRARVPSLTPLINQAIVGGIGLELLDAAHHHVMERAHGRITALDEEQIRSRGLAGVAAGQRELMSVLGDLAADIGGRREELKRDTDQASLGEIPVDSDTWAPELA